MNSIHTTRTQPGFTPAAQVTRTQLVELAARAMAALEEFMQALTPPEAAKINLSSRPERSAVEGPSVLPRKNYTTPDKASRAGNPPCPECGDETVRRTRRSNGSIFYGCINYPACKATTDAQHLSTRKGAMTH
jgi:Topoisomerase DNA binding C4 zinc finger